MAVQIPSVNGPSQQTRALGAPQVQTVQRQSVLDGAGRQIADAAAQIWQKSQDDADTTAIIDADNKLTAWQNNAFYNPETGVYSKKGSGALDITQQTMASFDKAQQQIGAGLTSARQRERYTQLVAQRQQSMSNDLNRYEYGQRQQYMDEVDNASIKMSQNSAVLNYTDPTKVGAYRQKAVDVVEARALRQGWSPEQTALAKTEVSSNLYSGVIAQMVSDSPQRAQQYYEKAKGEMTSQDQIRASSQIEQGFRRLEAEQRQRQVEARQIQAINRMELSSRVQDAQAAYMQGFQYDNPPNKADFVAAYGDKADAAYQSFAKVQAIAPAIQEFATATPEERQQILTKFNPAADGTASEGFKEDDSLYRRLISIGTGLLKQQQEDPAGYVARYSQPIMAAYQAAQAEGTPEAYERYAAATMAEQQRLGVQVPKLLPEAVANQIANQFSNVAEGGENAATLIEQQQQQWGKNFPLIAEQLGKKLPQEAQIIATGLPKDIAERMAAVSPLSEADLKKGLDKGVATEVAAAVQSELGDFAKSLSGQAGGINTFNTTFQAANKAALSYVRQGMKPNEAARKVAAGIVNDKYEFIDTYRVPKTQNVAAVRAGADRTLENIQADQLLPLPGLPGVTPEENARQLREAIIGDGQWVPNNDESGLSLTLNGYRVLGKDGKPIVKTWEDLEAEGLTKPEPRRPTPGLGIYN